MALPLVPTGNADVLDQSALYSRLDAAHPVGAVVLAAFQAAVAVVKGGTVLL